MLTLGCYVGVPPKTAERALCRFYVHLGREGPSSRIRLLYLREDKHQELPDDLLLGDGYLVNLSRNSTQEIVCPVGGH